MPPERVPKHRRTGPSFAKMAGMDFAKQIQVFALNGRPVAGLRLGNGDIVIKADCVEIDAGVDHSQTSSEGERWFAEVLEVKTDIPSTRESASSSDNELTGSTWVHVRWFYTENNLKRYSVTVGNLWSCQFGKRELALSDHEQVVKSTSILAKVAVRFFDELDRDQTLITKKELWYRYFLKTGKRSIDNRLILHNRQNLPPAGCGVTGCKRRYTPDVETQYLCPRESCGLWYHEQCLVNKKFQKGSRHYSHRLQAMLQGTPGFEDTPLEFFDELERIVQTEQEDTGLEDGWPSYSSGGIWCVVWCALGPIARGQKKYGIVGNEAIVHKARELIREIQDDLYPSQDDLEPFLKCVKPDPTKFMYGCMRCGLAI
ncbi:hypothetical protein BDV93DRAFT_560181 [Ceratobasidium sp. AG-I]|nr:hypothetical protein BDV93DRAFT_560181 [Ceratobasidium sp. AG-I]